MENKTEYTKKRETDCRSECKQEGSEKCFKEFKDDCWLNWSDVGQWRRKPAWKGVLGWLIYLPRVPFLLIIKLYQKTISPDHGIIKGLFPYGYCRFQPSCSNYGYRVIEKYGLIRGIPKAIWRIIRCNPWNEGGVDEA